MTNPEAGSENAAPSRSGWFEVRVSLTGMKPDDALCVALPPGLAGSTVSQLLAYTFPPEEEERHAVESLFDLRANPDLPEIYGVFLEAFEEWRGGRCTFLFSHGDGQDLDMAGLVSRQLELSSASAAATAKEDPSLIPPPEGGDGESPLPRLHIWIEKQYHAIDYSTQMGLWETREELLEWLQSLTLLYFLDKHEVEVTEPLSGDSRPGLKVAVAALRSKGLIRSSESSECSGGTRVFGITRKGRRFIGRLLAETESYIDRFDHFKDTEFDPDLDSVEFETGRGVDLRVQVFLAEGLDPIRTVFLLRLYDGSLDDSLSNWVSLIDDEAFFESILEPVVNRCHVDEAAIGQIVESGYGFLEEREERARELESQQEILRRVRA
jgi:hypothetical protein